MVVAIIEILPARIWSSHRLITLDAPLHTGPVASPSDKGTAFSSSWFQLHGKETLVLLKEV
jgi:hypothetical protein